MQLSSKNIRCDTSHLRTCGLCYERPLFFSEGDLNGHYQRYHNNNKDEDSKKNSPSQQNTSIQQLKTLEKSRDPLTKQLVDIKAELRRLNDSGLSKKRTTDIVRKEIKSLQNKICMKNTKIENIKLLIHKDEDQKQPTTHTKPLNKCQQQVMMHSFKQKMDSEYTQWLDSMSARTPVVGTRSDNEDSESSLTCRKSVTVAAEKIGHKSIEERLDLVESDIKRLKKHSFGKEGETLANTSCSQENSSMKMDFNKINMTSSLSDNRFQQSVKVEEALAKTLLEERLLQMTQDKEKIVIRNNDLSKELQEAVSSLKNAEKSIKNLTKDHQATRQESVANDARIKSLFSEIEELKVKSSTDAMDGANWKQKLAVLQEQLAATGTELLQKTELLEVHKDKLAEHCEQKSSLRKEIKCLAIEKAGLAKLVEDFEYHVETSEQCKGEIQTKLTNLQTERDCLTRKNSKCEVRIEELNKLKEGGEKRAADQNQKIENLEKEKAERHRELKKVTIEKYGVQKELMEMAKNHAKCRDNEKSMKISHEKTVQDMRNQLEQLLNEESQMLSKLRKEIADKESTCQDQLARTSLQKKQIKQQEHDIQESARQLKLCTEQQMKIVEEKTRLQEEFERLNVEFNSVKQSALSQNDDKIQDLEERLAEMEESKQKNNDQIQSLTRQLEKEKRALAEVCQTVSVMESNQKMAEQENERALKDLKESFEKERESLQGKMKSDTVNSAGIIQGLERELQNANLLKNNEIDGLQRNFEEESLVLRNKINELETDLDTCTSSMRQLESDADSDKEKEMTEMLAQAEKKCANQIEEMKSESAKERQDLERKISDLKFDYTAQKTGLMDQIELMKSESAKEKVDLEREFSDLKFDYSEQKVQIDQLASDNKKMKSKCEKDKKSVENQNERLVADNESLMLELFQKKEQDKRNKDEIKILKQTVDDKEKELKSAKASPKQASPGITSNTNEKELKVSQGKIVELSKSLFQCQQKYNDTIVEHDTMYNNLKKDYESDLRQNQHEIKDLHARLQEFEKSTKDIQNVQVESQTRELAETKEILSKRVVEIENLLAERTETLQQLEDFQQASTNFKMEEVKLRGQLSEHIVQNQDLTEKLFKAEKRLQKLKSSSLGSLQRSETKLDTTFVNFNENDTHNDAEIECEGNGVEYENETNVEEEQRIVEDDYLYSFNNDSSGRSVASSTSSKSVSSARSESVSCKLTTNRFAQNEGIINEPVVVSPKQSEQSGNKNMCFADEEIIPDDVTCCQDDDDFTDDDDFFGTKLKRKDDTSPVFKYEKSDDEEEDVVIPKRNWGENYMKGIVDENIEEEIGEECDESLASLDRSSRGDIDTPGVLNTPNEVDDKWNESNASQDASSVKGHSALSSEVDDKRKESNARLETSSVNEHFALLSEVGDKRNDSNTSLDTSSSGKELTATSGEESNTKIAITDKKKTKKSSKKVTKKKKSKESLSALSLPPLKGLPPLKTKSLFGSLPPLKGAPVIRSEGTLLLDSSLSGSRDDVIFKSMKQDQSRETHSPASGDIHSFGDCGSSEHDLLPVKSQKSNRAVRDVDSTSKNHQNSNGLFPVKSQKSSRAEVDATIISNHHDSPPTTTQTNITLARSQQIRSSAQQQQQSMGGMLGDLPPLPGTKSSLVITTCNDDDNGDDEDADDFSFGDNDIDGLLQDLDEFEVKNSKTK